MSPGGTTCGILRIPRVKTPGGTPEVFLGGGRASRYRRGMTRKSPPPVRSKRARRLAVVRRRGLNTLRRALARARVVLGVIPNFRRIRAANDPKA